CLQATMSTVRWSVGRRSRQHHSWTLRARQRDRALKFNHGLAGMTYSILVAVQDVIALVLIGLILVQHGKGADAGAAFGSGASGTVFGAKGSANFMSHATAGLATVFFLLSLTLAYLIGGNSNAPTGDSVTQQLQQQSAVTQSVDENAQQSTQEQANATATATDADQTATDDEQGASKDEGGVTAQV